MKKRFEFLIVLFGLFIIGLNFVSAAAPTFTTVPANSSLFYGNQSLSVIFIATNDSAFGNYSINNTNFTITQFGFVTGNQSAILINATPLAAGNYAINVTINNSGGGPNTSVTYTVQVNKSNYFDCGVYFNATTGITYPDKFLVWTNCTTPVTLARNGTTIGNNSVVNSGASAYNFSFFRTDTQNYSYTYNESEFRVIKNPEKCKVLLNLTSPQTYPKIFLAWANCTSAFVLSRNGTTIENNSAQNSLAVGAYNFSVFRNDTINYTFIYNYSQFIISPDITAPTYAENSSINVYVKLTSSFSIYIEDDSSLVSNGTYNSGMYIFSTNNTGVWVNDSAVNFTTTPSWANVTKILNETAGMTVGYMWYFNDTSFNTNSTPIYKLSTIQEEPVNNEKSGSTTSYSQTYTADEQFSGVGNEYNLKVSDKIKFSVGSTSHSLTLSKFNPTTATVIIASNPITAYLQKGILYKFDMNDDSVKDINVRYDGLVSGKASIFMQGIETVAPEVGVDTVDTSLGDEEAAVNDVASDQGLGADTSLGESKSSTAKIIIVIALVVIAIVVIFFLIFRKHKNRR